MVGGQQRRCTAKFDDKATAHLPLPLGTNITGTRVKWVLLTPAIFPAINEHTGGWLPSWIDHLSGNVQLKAGDTERQPREPRDNWRQRVKNLQPIPARLVAAIVGKPHPVTGFALAHEIADRAEGGAKSTHLAVPAGSVYYFACDSAAAATQLAAALNWHGGAAGTTIRNRRSTLLGEKGFGLGVCGTWTPYA